MTDTIERTDALKGVKRFAFRPVVAGLGALLFAATLSIAYAEDNASTSETPNVESTDAADAAADPTSAEVGKEQYEFQGCASCHGLEGEGGAGPKISGNPAVNNADALIQRILFGGGDMPPFSHLSDEEIAAISNFVRTELNSRSELVTAEDVAAFR